MKTRTSTWLAWGIMALSVVLAVVSWFLDHKNRGAGGLTIQWLLAPGSMLLFCAPGALIIAHRPGNSMGWLLCIIGLTAGLAGFTGEYGTYAMLTAPGSLPAGVVGSWLGDMLILPFFGLMPLIFLLFPTGKPLSRGWGVVGLATVATTVYLTAAIALGEPRLGGDGGPLNPTYVPSVGNHVGFDTLIMGLGLLLLLALASLLSVGVRYEQAQGIERQQLKWFAYGSVVLIASLIGAVPALWSGVVIPVLLGFGLFTSCIAVAILRYHLYDIDRLIRRTVTYGLLTVLLGLTYLGGVLLLRQVASPLTGQSNLAVAGSTLAVAALFQPTRGHIQVAVDQRFNRRRYDAARTIDTFTTRLSEQIDLDMLNAELLAVVDQTMQPLHASLWLRPPPTRSSQLATPSMLRPVGETTRQPASSRQ